MNPIFIHIPKTGGQSVNRAMGKKNFPHRHISTYDNARKRFAFAVVRNPYDRAVSLFQWYSELHLKEFNRTRHNAAMNMLTRGCSDVNDFWLNYVTPEILEYQKPYTPMMRSQMSFIQNAAGDGVDPRVNLLLRFEDLSAEFEQLEDRFGFSPLPHLNFSTRNQTWEEALTEEAKAHIKILYKDDFELLYPDL